MEIRNAAILQIRSGSLMRYSAAACRAKLLMQVVVVTGLVMACSSSRLQLAHAQLAPAPAPAAMFVNVTQLLVYGGDYSTFINIMLETKVDIIFQSIANSTTSTGITIFAPTDEAFQSKLATSLLNNLTASQKVSLVEYHALNDFHSLRDLQNSNQNQTATLASYNNGGGRYMLNISFGQLGVVQVMSDWTLANVTSMVYSQSPVSIFAVNQVLFPEDIFGLPSPAPAPAPFSGAPNPTPSSSSSSSSSSSGPSGTSNDDSFAPSSSNLSSLFFSLLISLFSLTILISPQF
ncbi:hypothetical protein GOP47_0010711 [Adiantum capillus-veneris]|uniref:FAS1 domain-containing protein n=1 Tax=Adiantum capillus-veneris TaxID=13818 RepID=A0A9D4UVT5_ADICA|nr:hypothetical protein GOP47_0010711 [Adiantum capillus-veneris]